MGLNPRGDKIRKSSSDATFLSDAIDAKLSKVTTVPAVANAREEFFKGQIDDAGNDAIIIVNGTVLNGSFMPMLAGYIETRTDRSGLNFHGLIPVANDVVGGAAIVSFRAATTNSATDPINGQWDAIANRDLFAWGTRVAVGEETGSNDLFYMTLGPTGVLDVVEGITIDGSEVPTKSYVDTEIGNISLTPGPQGDPGAPGQGFTWQGAWSDGPSYVPYDLVSWNGSVYQCIQGIVGDAPSNATYWSLFASKGDNGADGAVGPNTVSTSTATDITGVLYGNGSTVEAATTAQRLGSFTKAQLDTAVSDGNVVYVGDTISETATAATGTGGLVRATSPTLVTPNIGAATGTSAVLSGNATVGSLTIGQGTASTYRVNSYQGVEFWNTLYGYSMASIAQGILNVNNNIIGGSNLLLFGDTTAGTGKHIGFSSLANPTSAGADSRISKNASGVLQIGTTANNALGSLLLTNLTASGLIISGPFTVASLPLAASSARATTWVTNSSVGRTAANIGAVVAGGGAFPVPVICNGTDWRIL
jgi:hypothetical protein